MKVKELKKLLEKCDDDKTIVLSVEDSEGEITFYNPEFVNASTSDDFPDMINTSWFSTNHGRLYEKG